MTRPSLCAIFGLLTMNGGMAIISRRPISA